MTGLHLRGDEDLQRIANRLKEAGDKGLKRRVSASLRKVARPVGERVVRKGASGLPRRGGLSSRVASRGRVGVSNSLGGRSASVRLLLRDGGDDLSQMDRGSLRHPVYGRKTWVRQSIRAGLFSDALAPEMPAVRRELIAAANETLNDVAKGF